MYKRLLVPVDGSSCSHQTVGWALAFAKTLNADVTFLHVIESPLLNVYTLPGEALYAADLMPELEKAGTTLLEDVHTRARALGVKSETLMQRAEHPAQLILRCEADYDLTIMGTHSRRGLDRLFLGSVTEGVLRRSEKPQLVLRCPDGDAPSVVPDVLDRILIAVDGSPCSDHALEEGLTLAKGLGAQLTILSVLEVPLSVYSMPESRVYEPQLREDFKRAAELALDKARARATELGVTATTELVDEPGARAVEVILKRDETVHLCVMGTHGRRGVNRALLGSVAEGVIRQSSTPHLVVRCPAP